MNYRPLIDMFENRKIETAAKLIVNHDAPPSV